MGAWRGRLSVVGIPTTEQFQWLEVAALPPLVEGGTNPQPATALMKLVRDRNSKPSFSASGSTAPDWRSGRRLLGTRCHPFVLISDFQQRTFRFGIADELCASASFLGAQSPMLRIIGERPLHLGDGAYIEVVRPSAQRAVQPDHQLCDLIITYIRQGWMSEM